MALKLTKELTELRDGKAHFISLVDRSSSRLPFRIVKRDSEENGMALDLSRIHKTAEPTAKSEKATIAAVVVMAQKSDEATEEVASALKASGINTDKVVKNADGKTVTYTQPGVDSLDGATWVRLSDQTLVAVKGFMPQHEGMKDADFGATASANSFYQGVDSSLDTLFSKICSALTNATDEDEAGKSIGTLCDGFKKYVLGLVSQLPTAAFKADITLRQQLTQKAADGDEQDDISSPMMTTKLKNLLTNTPTGVAQNDWDKMGTDDKLDWLMDSTNTRTKKGDNMADCAKCMAMKAKGMGADVIAAAHKDNHMAKKADMLDVTDLANSMSKTPEGYTDGPEWGTLSTGDKLKWMAASYNEKTGNFDVAGAMAAKGDDCPECMATDGWNKMSSDEQAMTHKKHNGSTIKTETPVVKADDPKLDAILAGLTSLKADVQSIADSRAEDKKVLDALVVKSETVTQKLNSTVAALPAPGDTPANGGVPVQKTDSDLRTGAFDTAFIRKSARRG